MLNRYLDAIYCDDIRHESSGKMILIGVYSSVMYVASYPIILPKLCVSIKVVTPAETPFQKLIVRIFKDDDLISEVSADAVKLADMSVPDNDTDGLVERAQVVQFQATLTPVKLENNCVFRVRAQTDSEELRCPALRVEQAQPAGT